MVGLVEARELFRVALGEQVEHVLVELPGAAVRVIVREIGRLHDQRFFPGERGEQGGEPPPDPQSSGVWRSDDRGRTWRFLTNHNVRPMYFSILRVDPTNPEVVYTGGVQFYKSNDGGRTFRTMPGFGHVYHHAIWINPSNGRHVMIGNDGSIDVSYDEAATWESLRTWSVGQPYHASVDMRRPYFVCTGLQDNGSWCGPSSPSVRIVG